MSSRRREPAELAALLARKASADATAILDAEPVDRDATVALVDKVGRWAEAQIAKAAEEARSDEEEDESS